MENPFKVNVTDEPSGIINLCKNMIDVLYVLEDDNEVQNEVRNDV